MAAGFLVENGKVLFGSLISL